jgi:hypothetical protein
LKREKKAKAEFRRQYSNLKFLAPALIVPATAKL